MNMQLTKERRRFRTRRKLQRPVASERLRLTVFRSAKHIYAQVIDTTKGHTVAEANSKSLGLSGNKTEQAAAVGKALAQRAIEAGAKQIVFDRGSYRYHGRVKALADGAREGGLEF
jgi:large subunit ribosomal protein L18